MIRVLLVLFLTVFTFKVLAQDVPQPIVRTSLENNTAVPGHPLIFRITVLVPTWMPKPPVFPSFEAQNVVVRLPSRASGPTSERVDGETWSGVSRSYRLYPMVPGTFQIPGGSIKITYADPGSRDPIETEVEVEPFQIVGKAPPEAADLEPFLAAGGFSLKRSVEGDLENILAGDALILTTIAEIEGVMPMFVPPLSSDLSIEGVSTYPKEPELSERENRGVFSGTRKEVVTLVPEFAGSYQIPELTVSWYDLKDKTVKSATAPAIEFTVAGPAVVPEEVTEPIDPRRLAVLAGLAIVAAFLLFLVFRNLIPRARDRLLKLQHRIQRSEPYLYRQHRRALQDHNYTEAMRTGQTWRATFNELKSRPDYDDLDAAFATLGSSLFGGERHSRNAAPLWQSAARQLQTTRRKLLAQKRVQKHKQLPGLNA